MARRSRPRTIVLQGHGAAPGLACGPLRAPDCAAGEASDAVVVLPRAGGESIELVIAAAATVSLGGAVLSHAALLCRERGRPLIVFGESNRVGLLDPSADPEGWLLELGDVVGPGRRPTRLAAGDVVVVDGAVGELRVPGGLDAECRAAIRRAYAAVVALGRGDPGASAALAALAVEQPHLVVPFAVEAGLECGLTAADRAAELVAALRTARADALLDAALRAAAGAATDRGRRLAGRSRGLVPGVEDPDELLALVAEPRRGVAGLRATLSAAGASADELDAALDDLTAAAAGRRETLRLHLIERVARAAAMSDEALRARLAGLTRLARRAAALEPDDATVASLGARIDRLQDDARRELDARLVVELTPEAGARGRAVVGGKAAGLARIAAGLPDGCRIAPGFVVTTDGYRLHLLGGPGERLRELADGEPDEAALSRRARAAILGAPVPAELEAAIVEHASRIGATLLAVRSSAPLEDDPSSSLAGVFDTALGVRGADGLADRVRRTWASLWHPQAVALLGGRLRDEPELAMAVIVQAMIPTRVGGVMSTREPGGAHGLALVNAWWGLGAGIADGEVAGDLYWVRRDDGTVVATETGRSDRKVVLDADEGGTRLAPLGDDERDLACLDAAAIGRLAALAAGLERAEGPELEIEFGFDSKGTLYVFQCRRSRGIPA